MYKVLIADDNENNRMVVGDALEGEGYELVEACDGHEVTDYVSTQIPDLILLDIMMPGKDGLMVLKELKGDEEYQHIPVIMLTALNTETQVVECLKEGALDFITKPFSNMVMRAKVSSVLRSKISAPSVVEECGDLGKVITFIGAKGGVGTTTIATNVACCLAQDDHQVNLCELRPDLATMPLFLGIDSESRFDSLLSLPPEKISEYELKKSLIEHPRNVRTLVGPATTKSGKIISAEHATAIVSGLKKTAPFTIIDLPSSLYSYRQAVVKASDYVVVVAEQDACSIYSTILFLEKLKSWGVGRNASGLVINSRASVSSAPKLNEVAMRLDCKMIAVIPADPDGCFHALLRSSPIATTQSESFTSSSIKTLAEHLVTNNLSTVAF